MVATLLLPIEVTLIANVEIIRKLHLMNSVQGLTFPFLATTIGIFLIRQGFLGIPRDLRDASTLDGYGHLRFLFQVAMPMSKPIIGSFIVISFLGAWNQYVWPRFATDRNLWQTVQVALRTIGSENPDQMNLQFAAAILAATAAAGPADLLPTPDRPRPHRGRRQGLIDRTRPPIADSS